MKEVVHKSGILLYNNCKLNTCMDEDCRRALPQAGTRNENCE